MIRAALLANHEPVWANQAYGVVDENLVRVLERTLQVVDPDDVDTRARMLGAIAAELTNGDRRRHEVACATAEAAARRSGRPSTLASVLNGITVPSRPGQLESRRAWALEIIDLATTGSLDPDQVFAAHYHLASTMTEVGDFDGALVELEQARRVLGMRSSNRLNSQLYGFRGALLFCRGQYDEAATQLDKSYEVHRRNRRYETNVLYLAAIGATAFDRGGVEALVPAATPLIEHSAYGRSVAEVLAFVMLQIDQPDVAASLVDRFDATATFTDDYMTLCAMSAALHVRIDLGDTAGAAAIAEALTPYARRWACAGTSPLSMGPTALALARHAASLHDHETARRHFDAAVEMTVRAGAQPWLARTLVFRATHHIELGEFELGHTALERAGAIAGRYGLPYVERRLATLVS
jgi:tetratricopeptide (TPR) repeat protein